MILFWHHTCLFYNQRDVSFTETKKGDKLGQQQLLLIILGVIIVGIAIVVGFAIFRANAVEQKRNNVINDLIHLKSIAQRYYRTPSAMGGGSQSFDGWTIPTKLQINANGSFSVVVFPDKVEITGIGNEAVQGSDLVEVKMIVTSHDYKTEIIH